MRRFACVLLLASAAFAQAVNQGHVLSNPRVHLIFWGAYWQRAEGIAAADSIVCSYGKISPDYFQGLVQYGVQPPALVGMTTATSYEPPVAVADYDVAILLQGLVDSAKIPRPSGDMLYMVMLPPGSRGFYLGWHSPLVMLDGSHVQVAYVGDSERSFANMLHELIEGATDPNGDGVQMTPVRTDIWNEIVDACGGELVNVNGVQVPSYWSQSDRACVVPGADARRVVVRH